MLAGSREVPMNGLMLPYMSSKDDDRGHLGEQAEVTTSSEAVSDEAAPGGQHGRQGQPEDAGCSRAHVESYMDEDRAAAAGSPGAGPAEGLEEAAAACNHMHDIDGEHCALESCPGAAAGVHAVQGRLTPPALPCRPARSERRAPEAGERCGGQPEGDRLHRAGRQIHPGADDDLLRASLLIND